MFAKGGKINIKPKAHIGQVVDGVLDALTILNLELKSSKRKGGIWVEMLGLNMKVTFNSERNASMVGMNSSVLSYEVI